MTLRDEIERILAPVINPAAPYGKALLDQIEEAVRVRDVAGINRQIMLRDIQMSVPGEVEIKVRMKLDGGLELGEISAITVKPLVVGHSLLISVRLPVVEATTIDSAPPPPDKPKV